MNANETIAVMVDSIESAFFEGAVDLLKGRRCPICESGKLLFNVRKDLVNVDGPPGRRYKGSVNIYCQGTCNRMITHANAFIPAWAEGVSDWEQFSESLG